MLHRLSFIVSLFTLSSAFNCCVDQTDSVTCTEAQNDKGLGCTWIDSSDTDSLAISAGVQCVSTAFWDCNINGVNCPPPKPPAAAPPKPPVPPQCLFDTCTNTENPMNVMFVIDESGSVGRTNYLISLDFVENMVENDINEVSNISMLAFSSGLDRIYHFSDAQDDQKAGALAALQQEKANYNGGMTATATALREAVREYTNTPGISASDDNKLFLLTDGYPNTGGNVCDEKASLDAAGITVYIVGISGGFSKSAVKCLVNDDEKRILTIPKFQAALFWQLESQLRRVVCPVVFYEEEENDKVIISEKFEEIAAPLIETQKHQSPQIIIGVVIVGFIMAIFACYYKRASKTKEQLPILAGTKVDVYTSSM